MKVIVFFDTEIDPKSGRILDIGGIRSGGSTFHGTSVHDFLGFLEGAGYLCGHNIFAHDLKYLEASLQKNGLINLRYIDTLFLSPLLFPTRPYHALLKDDKLQTDEINNPLNDSLKAKELFLDELSAFRQLDPMVKQIFYGLLAGQKEFQSFFHFVDFTADDADLESLIHHCFSNDICKNLPLKPIISNSPIELAYALSLIHSFVQHKNDLSITPPWVLKNYPDVERLLFQLRNKPCLSGCEYCHRALDIHRGLKRFFGFDSYRKFGNEPLQELAVQAAIDQKSLLAVFPTGGGKSLTFQVPALMSGDNTNGLTVVISPLQSLMKDQVDNLERLGITQAVTINGSLDPIERAKAFERVEDGSACILYISPESLRSKSIERLVLGRKLVRFVIDEAHCFSAWGQDFRVDYLYIAEFIRRIQEKKNLSEPIPISSFTATAKPQVIQDIILYFKEKLSVDLQLFTSSVSRTNLQYKVVEKGNEEEKYLTIRDWLDERTCPVIIYVARTGKADLLTRRLSNDGFSARAYHGKMDKHVKSENQDAFVRGEVQVMVATSAFGMGVDKKDVGLVVHYDISDSLENYVQEAGRAGRDESMLADCFVLYNEDDLSKHFILLNQTKLSLKEIQEIWRAIKELTKVRSSVSQSALEIARKAGWDDDMTDIETRVTTAIAALEEAGYVKRGQNNPRIFANSILARNAQEAIDTIQASERFNEKQKVDAIRVMKKLISSRSRKSAVDDKGESRMDYISDHLGIAKKDLLELVNLLREEKILADAKDLTAFIIRGENPNRPVQILQSFAKLELFLQTQFTDTEKTFHLKELNEIALAAGCEDVSLKKIKTVFNLWAIKHWIKRTNRDYSRNHVAVIPLFHTEVFQKKLEARHQISGFLIQYLYEKSNLALSARSVEKDLVLVEFSIQELKHAFEKSILSYGNSVSAEELEDALFFLSRIEAMKMEGGFLLTYNGLTIKRLEQDNKIRYKIDDYQKLNQFYENKVQQIHIVGEYAKKMITNYRDALQFVDDYFQLNYSSFLNKHFKGSRQNEIKRNITPAKFRQLFGELSPSQLHIIRDKVSLYMLVAAGPGSGKTKVLVHKLASLLLMEDVKHDQLLMLTFSRAAATEFKKRLISLIGAAAHFVEIKTFHSFCFDLLGKMGNLDKADEVIGKTIAKIKSNEVEQSKITKAVLVIDEAQDMAEDEFLLIRTLMENNESMRVIAVGDDDQNIFEFRGASSRYLVQFLNDFKALKYEIVENYRSKSNLVDFSNRFVEQIGSRLKANPIVPKQLDHGKIRLVKYESKHLITPLAEEIVQSGLSGTTCVLVRTNDEAMQVAGVLQNRGLPAKLIQTNDSFSLANLLELRFFLKQLNLHEEVYVIDDDRWNTAKMELIRAFRRSTKLDMCKNLIKDFEAISPSRKFKTDLDAFIRDSRLEDFITPEIETIFVSTIHKAKGKEFDNVFLMLEDFNADTDKDKRLIYVALTRAKQNLSIHLNSGCMDKIHVNPMQKVLVQTTFQAPKEILVQLTHREVWLDYFNHKQHWIKEMVSGDHLIFNEKGCMNQNEHAVLRFSSPFVQRLHWYKQKGFIVSDVRVNFILHWKKEGEDKDIMIILPEIRLLRNSGNAVNEATGFTT